jgi:hypothetical protein
MGAVERIQELLSRIGDDERNNAGAIHLNILKNEFITFPGTVAVPRIPLKGLDPDRALPVVAEFARFLPEFFHGHRFLVKRVPASDLYSLQFVRRVDGRVLSFVHMLRVDLRFGGDSSNIIVKGDSDNYPSYQTDRMYYKSRLIPAGDINVSGGAVMGFTPVRLFDSMSVESAMDLHTFAVFEDVDEGRFARKIIEEIVDSYGDIFSVSRELYPFIAADHFTACFNVAYPTPAGIDAAVRIFEPLFIEIYGRYRPGDGFISPGIIEEKFADSLESRAGGTALTGDFVARARDYFGRFRISRDDALALKEWWRVDIA